MNGRNKHSKKKNFRSNDENANDKGKNKKASKFSSDITGSLQSCKKTWETFERVYKQWCPVRRNSILELKKLAKEVNQDQMTFNNTSLMFKQANVMSRRLRTNNESNLDTFASIASLVTDVIGGINSIAQACNVDRYMERFGDIMKKDAEVTLHLYRARSNCFDEYRAVDEIIRRYHSDTFGDTFNKITKTLKTEDMWLELKNSQGGNSMSQITGTIEAFLGQLSRVEVLNDVRESVVSYADSNPAVWEACESTGKALYGIYETWGYDKNSRNSILSRNLSTMANNVVISREEREICRLRRLVSDESEPQAKIEWKIQEAISDFEKEEREMRLLFESSAPFRNGSDSISSHSDYAGASHFREEMFEDYAGAACGTDEEYDDYTETSYGQRKFH